METIFTNSGYHYIARNILKYLHNESFDFQTFLTFSYTNKEIMKVCESFMMAKERRKPIFENLNCQSCEDVFTDLFQDFISFVKENEIFYSGYFHLPKEKNKERKILIQFLEKLSELKGVNIFEIIPKLISRKCKCSYNGNRIFQAVETFQSITQKYVKFIPPNCPTESKRHLMKLLHTAVCWKKLEMAKILLASLKNHDTCLSLTISAMEANRHEHTKVEAHLKWMDEKAPFLEKIAIQCKNPNAPNEFRSTALHLIAKMGLYKIAKVLLPLCNNLDVKDQNGKTPVDLASENGHYKIVKILEYVTFTHKALED